MSNASKVTVNRTPITIDKIYVNDKFQKAGTKSVQLRQIVTTISEYDSKKPHNDLSAGLFKQEEFGFEAQVFTSISNRVAWENVPVAATEDEIKARIAMLNATNGVIFQILSNTPILTKQDKDAIASETIDTTIDNFANSQVVRYSEGHAQAGQIILDNNGKVQYRRVGVLNREAPDTDNRTEDPNDTFITAEIAMELQGAGAIMQNQGV